MKKNLIYFSVIVALLLFAGIGKCLADPVDSIIAKTVALNFYSSKSSNQVNNFQLVHIERADDNTPVYYVFNINNKNGFVIVSADDVALPILGYSLTGQFRTTDRSCAFEFWMNGYKDQIRFIKNNKLNATQEISQKWANYITQQANIPSSICDQNAVSLPLITKWYQNEPYYNDCPYNIIHQVHTLTGCVATAMAQIMRYWSYPSQGTGSHTYVPFGYLPQSVNFSNATYDWENMPPILNSNWTQSQKNEVAKLMYHCGVSVEMDYGIHESSAYMLSYYSPYSSENAYKTYFRYNSNTIQGKLRSNFTLAEWIGILKNEINNGRPIQYAGSGNLGGHSWVCHGYDVDNFFQMNWGWNGDWDVNPNTDDGYYNIEALNLGTSNFNSNHQALIGIQPMCSIADLTIINQSVSNCNPTAGSQITASCSENNNGETSAGVNKIKIYLSDTSVLNLSSATYLGQLPVSIVAALGQTILLNTSVTIPSNTSSGQHWLFFYADGDEDINECYENNNFGSVLLNVNTSTCPQPTNDGCTGNFNATQLIFSTTCNFYPSTSCGATSSGFNACSGNADDDVFFRFVPTTSNVTIKVASTNGFDAVFQLLTGPCGPSMQPLAPGCINNTGDGGLETHSYSGLTTGNTYFIRVWHAGASWGNGNFSICVYGSTCTNPGIANPISPGNPSLPGQVINTITPQFNWSLASGATRYVVRVSKEPYGFNNIVYTSACVTPPLTIPTAILQNGSNYRWDVEALFACGSSCKSLSADYYFTVSTAPCTSPSIQTSSITFPMISSDQMNVSWTNGDGNRRIVKINTINSFAPPVNGTTNPANSNYSGSGEQIVYDGSGGSVLVTGLSASSNYCFRVYEANCSGSYSMYNTSAGTNNPLCQSTTSSSCITPSIQASNISFYNIGSNSIGLNWSSGNGNRRIVKINTSNSFTAPTNGTDPAANSIYQGSGEQVVYNGSGNSITITGLALGTNYCFRVYEARCSGVLSIYNTTTASNNPNCQSTTSSCNTPQIPVPLIGIQTCPGPGFYNSALNLKWSNTGSGHYDIEIRQYPYGASNVIYSQYCLQDTSKFVSSSSLVPGKLYSWRVRSTMDCNTCNSAWSQPYYFHMAPTTTPSGSLYICNASGIELTTPTILPPSPATVSYQWFRVNNGSNDIPVGTNATTYFVSITGTYYVKLIYNGTTICPGNDTTYASTFDSVHIGFIPSPPTLGTTSPVFQGSNLLLSALSSIPGNPDYFWSGPNGFASNSANNTIPSVTTNASGIYSCYTINDGCQSETATTQVFVILPSHTTYRYWYDNRFDNSVSGDLGTGNNFNLQQNFSATQLSYGLHVINMQFMGTTGMWSSVTSSFFYKPYEMPAETAKYEYWFDNNYSSKTQVNNSSTNNFILLTDLPVGSLSEGLHVFSIRFRPDGKTWSSAISSFFYYTNNAPTGTPQYEYWFDNADNNKTTATIASTNNFNLLDNIITNSINNGLHTLNVRFRPDGKKWSSVITSFFYKDNDALFPINNLAKFVYWYDNNWQAPKTISIIGTQNINWTLNTDAAELSEGRHNLSMSFKDDRGKWSSIVSDSFTKAPITAQTCFAGNRQFISGIISGGNSTYQWQLDSGTGFANISNNAFYSGTSNDTLVLTNAPTSWYGYKYRCLVTNGANTLTGVTYILKFATTWNGSTDNAWENPANWSCNAVPDANTDVYINAGMPRYAEINSNAACRRLYLQPGTSVEIKPGKNLDITGKDQ